MVHAAATAVKEGPFLPCVSQSTNQVSTNATDFTAEFLLTRGPYAWLGFGWSGCYTEPRPRPEVWDLDYVPSAQGAWIMERLRGHVPRQETAQGCSNETIPAPLSLGIAQTGEGRSPSSTRHNETGTLRKGTMRGEITLCDKENRLLGRGALLSSAGRGENADG
jgi:hypothetical protein